MKNKFLLTAIALLILSLTSFAQTSQVRTYKTAYFKMYKEGELTTSSPLSHVKFIFDESANRIELDGGEGYQNRIFKIDSHKPDPIDKNCTIYITQMRTNNGHGQAVVIIVVDKFEKLIRVGSFTSNEEGFKNYLEYQYD